MNVNIGNIRKELSVQFFPCVRIDGIAFHTRHSRTHFGDDQTDRSDGDQEERKEGRDKYKEEKNGGIPFTM